MVIKEIAIHLKTRYFWINLGKNGGETEFWWRKDDGYFGILPSIGREGF